MTDVQRTTAAVTASPGVHAALVGLVRAILEKKPPPARYAAERALIGAVEEIVGR